MSSYFSEKQPPPKEIKASPSSNCYLILDQEHEQLTLGEANLWGIWFAERLQE